MKVRIFRQRVSQVHESETEINEWLEEMGDSITVRFIEQSSYLTDNTENGQPGYVVSVWYD
ncbi:MAG: hypothetical protein ISP91_01490 [Pseudomonadales bacterium]|jgi:hypothetical protein|nr:hypothetical protein [Pseudomonadales bacterium]